MLEKGKHVCVIGAGTMGSGIAAHLANIGFEVSLLDRDTKSVREAFERAKANRPPHFYLPSTAEKIRLGNIQDNLDWVAEADWVCEAVVEKLDIKKALFAQIDPLLKPDALVSTNTSGLQIGLLSEGMPDHFRERFLGTHFFNPPRYLKLLELIPTEETRPSVVESATRFFEEKVARRVVVVKDTPGFIANRFGMWSMYLAVHVAEQLGLSIEEVDAITGPLIGRPKSASFRLNDIVGLDIMQDIATNLIDRCPHDAETKWLKNPKSLQYLLDQGWIGSKTRQGYYKREAGQFLAFDLKTNGYRELRAAEFDSIKPLMKLPLAERLQQALELRDPVGEYLREYLLPSLRYAHSIRKEISHNVRDFDRVMMWGFGWEAGPFEMIDMIGHEKVGLQANNGFYVRGSVQSHDGGYVEPEPEPEFRSIHDYPVVDRHESFNVRDLGDGVTGVSLTTKMGVVTPTFVSELTRLLQASPPERLVVASEAKVFSVGFDLKFFVESATDKNWDAISDAIHEFQQLGVLLHAIPSVAAVSGYCLGGGFEVAASCQAIVAGPESQIGLPESKVGLIPGGGGTPIMRLRSQHSAKELVATAKNLAYGVISTSADNARTLGFLRHRDVTCYHPDRVLTDAIALAKAIDVQPRPDWEEVSGPFKGMVEAMQSEGVKKGELTDYDREINDRVKRVFAGPSSFDEALGYEHTGFVELIQDGLTIARMRHMLETGKPLHN